MKKQKAKKAGGAKKKDDKPEAEASSATDKAEEKTEESQLAPEPPEATSASPGPVDDDEEPAELPKAKATSHGRKPSVAVESRQRSASFYRGGAAGAPTSPTAMTPGGGVSGDIYREQAQRIEELERDNKRLAGEVEEGEKRWRKGEEELEELREGRADVALALERGKEAEKLVRHRIYELQHYVHQVLIFAIEVGSRITQEAIVTSPVTKFENKQKGTNRLT